MDNNVTLQTILDVMNTKFAEIDARFDKIDNRLNCMDKRFDGIDNRLDSMDKRFDGIDNRISKLAGDNKEEHEKIFEQLTSITNTLTRLETEHEEKIQILFDAINALKDSNTIIKGQLHILTDKVTIHGIKILNLEKDVFGHN